MMVQRFFYSAAALDLSGTPGLDHYESRLLGAFWITRVHCHHWAVADIEAIVGHPALPNLTAPATSLPAPVLAYLANHGIVPAATDNVLNVLRAVRDALGESASSFDINGSS
jgi:hypothetical protein